MENRRSAGKVRTCLPANGTATAIQARRTGGRQPFCWPDAGGSG